MRNGLIKETKGSHISENVFTLLDKSIIFVKRTKGQNCIYQYDEMQEYDGMDIGMQINDDVIQLAPTVKIEVATTENEIEEEADEKEQNDSTQIIDAVSE